MSAIRSIAQIPASIKYLEAVLAYNALYYNASNLATYPAFYLDGVVADLGGDSTVELDTANTNLNIVAVNQIGGSGSPIGTLFKDLGRQLLLVDSDANHVALFRHVQLVQGADTEGVGGAAPTWNCLFVKVWSADGQNVCVVRTGPGSPA